MVYPCTGQRSGGSRDMALRHEVKFVVILYLIISFCSSFCFHGFKASAGFGLSVCQAAEGDYPSERDEDSYFSKLREEMVRTQIEARGIRDKRVLKAMRKVPRHKFVPRLYRKFAYEDTPLPIGEKQTISQPYIVALMTELLDLAGEEKVLEIGTGSGYQAAILAELAAEVYTIEIFPSLAQSAGEQLGELGYRNVEVKCGDGYLGWEEYAPFDVIIVTCAPEEIPKKLVEQLADGGKMVIPVGSVYQELKLIEKRDGEIKVRDVIPVRFVPMRHLE
jgi:protein-L-isoaspartate(D-aspartate) O-methyltransferase